MRSTKIYVLFAFVLLLFNCCKTDEPKPIEYDSYLPLAVGNYWIYQHFKINADGTEIPLNQFDSVYISAENTANDNNYFSFFSMRLNSKRLSDIAICPSQLCDSAGYLVESLGGKYRKFFSSISTDTLSTDTIYVMYKNLPTFIVQSKMNLKISKTSVPAGEFDVIVKNEYCDCFFYKPENSQPKLEKKVEIIQPALFAKNIGIVKKTYYWYSDVAKENGIKQEIRLVRYHVK